MTGCHSQRQDAEKKGAEQGLPFFMSYALKLLIVLTRNSLHLDFGYTLVAILLHFFQKASVHEE